VGAGNGFTDIGHRCLGRVAGLLGLAPCAQPAVAQLDDAVGRAAVSACASVLALTNSTPCTLRAIMCSTALLPPPPTPITLIWVPWLNSSASIISMVILELLVLNSYAIAN